MQNASIQPLALAVTHVIHQRILAKKPDFLQLPGSGFFKA